MEQDNVCSCGGQIIETNASWSHCQNCLGSFNYDAEYDIYATVVTEENFRSQQYKDIAEKD